MQELNEPSDWAEGRGTRGDREEETNVRWGGGDAGGEGKKRRAWEEKNGCYGARSTSWEKKQKAEAVARAGSGMPGCWWMVVVARVERRSVKMELRVTGSSRGS